eukprot:m.164405 g.164405  ORF g.164405 m.164405 type:complete len:559 (-) comp12421_c0_seq1:2029-3705(-)
MSVQHADGPRFASKDVDSAGALLAMGSGGNMEEGGHPAKAARTMTTLGLVVVGFFWTSGGFYGCEPAMDGPHLYMLILGLVMPLLYSLPTALISAELATNYPETGGQCVYVSLACGPLVGAHNTWWVWFSTCVDCGLYPQYIRDTLIQQFDLTPGNGTNSDASDVIGSSPEVQAYEIMKYVPMMVIAFVTSINILGVDWLMRFETFLGVMAALPCLVFLGFGIPHIRLSPNMNYDGNLVLASMVSRSLWLYGGFTNLGVLAGECRTPRRSYLIAVFILVPLKILLRFVPFLVAYSYSPTSEQLTTAGYFQEVAGFVGATEYFSGDWLAWWYFGGSLICFLGFYNAMAVNAERTMMYFCEERYAYTLDRLANKGGPLNFIFRMPGEEEGGIRRFYILFIALVEIGMVNINVGLLIELEMLIYAMSAGLFFYSFIYLRLQRVRKFKDSALDPTKAPLLLGADAPPTYGSVDVDSKADIAPEEVFNIGGGNIVAFMIAIPPIAFFAINTVLNLMGKGSDLAPFPYFKQTVFVGVIFVGILANLWANACAPKTVSHITDDDE